MSEEPTIVQVHENGHGIHLPPPSYWPIVLAIGLTAALIGLLIHPAVWIAGLVVIVVALAGWFREIGADITAAPSEPE